jgi:hypothetical protein
MTYDPVFIDTHGSAKEPHPIKNVRFTIDIHYSRVGAIRFGGLIFRSFVHRRGGIHVSAIQKDPVAYEHFDPALVGNRRRMLVSDLSGKSNIAYKAREPRPMYGSG